MISRRFLCVYSFVFFLFIVCNHFCPVARFTHEIHLKNIEIRPILYKKVVSWLEAISKACYTNHNGYIKPYKIKTV